MKIELKNVKVFAAGSEETICFVANIYIDGKKRGEARNDGHGGPTTYHMDKIIRLDFEVFAASMPDKVFGDISIKMNGEHLIDDLLDAHLKKKDAARTRKIAAQEKAKHRAAGFPVTVQIEFGDQILWCACRAETEVPDLLAHMSRKHKMVNPTHRVLQ